MTEKTPIPVLLMAFLSKDALVQERLFHEPLPTWRGSPAGPIARLLNAVDTYIQYFFDHCEIANSERLRIKLKKAIDAARSKDSRDDFLGGEEWQAVRAIASSILVDARVTVEPPSPLPLDEWTDHFYWTRDKPDT